MNERQFFNARDAAKQEYEEKLRALDSVWVMLNKSQPPKQPPTRHKRQRNIRGGSPLAAALSVLVGEMTETFNTVQIDTSLRKANPELADVSRSTVTHTLRRIALGKSAPIEILEVGKGKRPTTYRRLLKASEVSVDDL